MRSQFDLTVAIRRLRAIIEENSPGVVEKVVGVDLLDLLERGRGLPLSPRLRVPLPGNCERGWAGMMIGSAS